MSIPVTLEIDDLEVPISFQPEEMLLTIQVDQAAVPRERTGVGLLTVAATLVGAYIGAALVNHGAKRMQALAWQKERRELRYSHLDTVIGSIAAAAIEARRMSIGPTSQASDQAIRDKIGETKAQLDEQAFRSSYRDIRDSLLRNYVDDLERRILSIEVNFPDIEGIRRPLDEVCQSSDAVRQRIDEVVAVGEADVPNMARKGSARSLLMRLGLRRPRRFTVEGRPPTDDDPS